MSNIRRKLFSVNYILGFWIFFVVVESGCKKDSRLQAGTVNNLEDVFRVFWREMNERYLYWEQETTDWKAVFNTYLPRFKALNIDQAADVQQAASLFREITSPLIDGHFQIKFTHPLINNQIWQPAWEKLQQRSDYHAPFDYPSLIKGQLQDKWEQTDGTTLPGRDITALSGWLNDSVVYFHCNAFYLNRCYVTENSPVKTVITFFLNALTASRCKGAVLDLRGNGGGELMDLSFLMGKCITAPLWIGYTRNKSGIGPQEFTAWLPVVIQPGPPTALPPPIAVLQDQYSASLAETLSIAVRATNNGVLVGERTWGATGPVSDPMVFGAGSFKIPGFMEIVMSSNSFKDSQNKIYEGIGVEPDISVPFDEAKLVAGIDEALQAAVLALKD